MKNIFKIAFIALALVLSTVSCDNIDTTGFEPDTTSGWIEFETGSDQIISDAGSIVIPIEYNVPINREDVTVSYDVAVVEGEAPGTATGSFTTTVPADTRDVSIAYDIDPTIESSYTLQFTITGTSNPNVIVGLEGDNPIVHTLEVCRLRPLAYTGVAFIGESQINTFDAFLTRTDECNVFSLNSAWGTNFVAEATGDPSFDGQFIYEANLIVNPDLTVVIEGVGDDAGSLPGSVDDSISISGNFIDPETDEIRYSLEQGLFSNPFLVEVILTPVTE